VPDHGKLNPWRFVVMAGDAKAGLVETLSALAETQPNPTKAQAALAKLSVPPVSVLVVFSPKPGSIPLWEQELSAGAVCMNMLIAAQAMGFGANWITALRWVWRRASRSPASSIWGRRSRRRWSGYGPISPR
jgi:nitroreductase